MELTKPLAEAAAKRFIDSGAENYTGDVFTITRDDGQPGFEVLVTVQKVGAPTPHDLRVTAEQQRDKMIDLLRKAAITLNNRRAYEDSNEILAFLETV